MVFLKAAFLLIGGFLLCGAGVWFAVAHAELARNGERAPGIVVDISVQKVRGSKLHHAVVRYQPAGQEPTRFKERTGLWSSLFEIGDTVTVLYYPNAPTEAKIRSFWTLWFLPLIMALMGAACLVAGRYTLRGEKG